MSSGIELTGHRANDTWDAYGGTNVSLDLPPSSRNVDSHPWGVERNMANSVAHSLHGHGYDDSQVELITTRRTEVAYLPVKRMVFLTAGLMLAMFVVALDNTIISTAIPDITTQFDSLLDVGWCTSLLELARLFLTEALDGSVYILCSVALQPVFGKICLHCEQNQALANA